VPGVESAAVNRCVPFTGCSRTVLFLPERPVDRTNAPGVGRHYISSDYFRTLGIPIRAGRALTPSDPAHAVEIVGVVGDIQYEGVEQPDRPDRADFYTSYLQFSYPDTMVIVKTRGAASSLLPAMRAAVAS